VPPRIASLCAAGSSPRICDTASHTRWYPPDSSATGQSLPNISRPGPNSPTANSTNGRTSAAAQSARGGYRPETLAYTSGLAAAARISVRQGSQSARPSGGWDKWSRTMRSLG
jgi:hypothetical protein